MHTLSKVDFSARDQEGNVVFYVPLWKRRGLSLELFDDYWRDVHGPVCARLPGQFQYWQFHVAHNDGGIWPTIDGINYTTPEDDQFDGIAELSFKSIDDRNTWFQAAAILMDDEHNIFRKAIGYNTNPDNSKTYLDTLVKPDPNGSEHPIVKLYVLVRKQDAVSVADFRQYLVDRFAPSIVKSESLAKFRLHLFEEVDNSRPPAAGVDHGEAVEKNYQAAFELAFANKLDLERFFVSPEYTSTTADQPKYLKQISTFPERTAYTFVYDGKITLAGQRASSVAQLIADIGATNQLQPDVEKLMFKGVL